MSAAKMGLIGSLSAVVSFLAVFLIYIGMENFPGMIKIAAVVLSALAIGICQGFFIERAWHRTIGIGTFTGILILWLPVIAVTYGFALLALPFLAAFAMVVFYGAKLGARFRTSL
ncbi:hypothetical protein GTP46_14155 [Duganella sp. FT135W]|uniref:Uncharacterized protein n=1 Tax=Duganella flavida TaxID=2692175 RepID=A0A6L8K8J1_9BURK|nr:hypothetical protein [Duganella flavida]MYM23793.1 hypothetical protein [Duganella flavida]